MMSDDTHLNADVEQRIFENLKTLRIGCVFATHNPGLLELADDVALWQDGVPAQARPRDIEEVKRVYR